MDNKYKVLENNLKDILESLGFDTRNNSTKDTPMRVVKMWMDEFFYSINNKHIEELDKKMKLFEANNNEELIILKDIDFSSICEHHLLPFSGKINVAYAPNGKIIGLSKIPRVVKYFSKRPQVQERLVEDIGDYLYKIIQPQFILIEAEATHDCVMCRGAESFCSTNTMFTKVNNLIVKNEAEYQLLINKYKDEYYKRR